MTIIVTFRETITQCLEGNQSNRQILTGRISISLLKRDPLTK